MRSAEGSDSVAPPGPGLTEAEAARRLREEGSNELPRRARRGGWLLAREVLSEPLILLLLGAAGLYLAFGEPRDALVLGASVAVVITLDIYQETRAEHALEALQELAVPEVTVFRDGARRTLPASRVVRGDLVALVEGARVPADGEVRSGRGLLVDESLLTGESAAVAKSTGDGRSPWVRPGGEELPFVYAQTLVVRGAGWMEVRATGARSEASRIASALAEVETATPLIRQQTRPLVLGVGVIAVALTVLLAVVVGWRTGDWIVGLLAGTALAIGLLPEEIPVVTTVYSVLGARRIAQHRALARRFGTIPTLGCLTVLCTDKTGTLTQNRMRVAVAMTRPGEAVPLPEEGPVPDGALAPLLTAAARASDPEPTDPTEVAIVEAERRLPAGPRDDLVLVRHLPFSHDLRVVRNLFSEPARGRRLIAAKGAPEDLLSLCVLGPGERLEWEREVAAFARDGYRTLGVAVSDALAVGEGPDPESVPLRFLGVLALADPLRPGVPGAVASCREAGVRVVLITGDHPETARAVARAAGIAHDGAAVTGRELEELPADELRERVRSVNVYARVRPEQKLALVKALLDDGEVVGMTGDGVNDAPALKAAHVGIAMGRRGTDVAREAASLVLLDDAFPTIAEAIRTGRRVYENMRKALVYVVAIHVAIAGMAILPVLAGLPVLLFPVEIVFLELIIDPVASLVFEAEPEEPDVMRRPPRDPAEPLVGRRALLGSLAVGGTALAVSIAVYAVAVLLGHPEAESRALGFAGLLIGNLAIVFLCRSSSRSVIASGGARNPLAWAVTAFGVGLLLISIYLPPVASVFQFAPPSPIDLLAVGGLAAVAVLLNDAFKRRWLSVPARARGG